MVLMVCKIVYVLSVQSQAGYKALLLDRAETYDSFWLQITQADSVKALILRITSLLLYLNCDLY